MIVAVTGNTGGGKTTVARLFEEWGAIRIDADELGRDVWQKNRSLQEKIVEAFGPGVTGEDGLVERKQLGRFVFADRGRLATFDAIIQPVLRERIGALLDKAAASGGTWVLDAALLFEWGHADKVDRIVAVLADPGKRADRIAERDGIGRPNAESRVRVQQDEEAKAERADYVLRNDGTLEDLEAEARKIWNLILSNQEERDD